MAVIMSSDAKNKNWTLLYGPTKAGKTYAAATVSKHFVPKGPATLSDILWVQFDQSGMGTLDERGLVVPMVDMRDKSTEKQIVEGIAEMHKDIKATVAAGQTRYVVIDGLSTLSDTMYTAMAKRLEGFPLWGALGRFFTEFMTSLTVVPCPIIFIGHSAMLSEDKAEKGGPMAAKFDLNVKGSAAEFIKNQCGNVLPVLAEVSGGKKKHYMLTTSAKGYYAGTHRPDVPVEIPNDLGMFLNTK